MLASCLKLNKEKMRWWLTGFTEFRPKVQFREASLLNCNEGAREGILDFADWLVTFVLYKDRIQTIVRSRYYQNFDEIAETALVEESSIAFGIDRYRLEGTSTQNCGNCGKLGHASNKCYAQERRKREWIKLCQAVRGPPVKLLAYDAVKRATWPEIIENHRGDGKVVTPLRCREKS
jgi:hypothetical protein